MKQKYSSLKVIVGLTTLSPLILFLIGNLPILSKVANTSGYIGLIMILWSIVLGSKPLARLLSSDYVELNKIHRFLGKYGVIFALIHPLLEMYSYLENFSWIITPDFSTELEFHISLGRLSLLLLLIIWISSITLRSRLKYRPWLRIHYLTYPLGFLVLAHMRDIGFYYSSYPIISIFFNITFLLYAIYLIYLGLLFAGFFKKQYTIKSIKKIGQGSTISVLDLETSGKPIQSNPGQYVYIQLRRFGEVKPFSILQNNGNTLRLGIKLDGSFTEKVSTLQKGHKIGVYGSLGKFTAEGQGAGDKIIISGGIGITPLIELAEKNFTDNSYFFVCNRFRDDVVDLERLKKATKNKLYEIYSRETEIKNDHQRNCRLDQSILGEILSGVDLANYKVFLCGSSRFMNETIKNLVAVGVKKENIYTEDFSF